MEIQTIYQNVEHGVMKDTRGAETPKQSQDEGKALKSGGSRCWVLMTVSLGLICVLLLVFIIIQHITITAERDLMKNTLEDLNQTISSLQDNHTHLTQKLESKVSSLSDELHQLYSKQVFSPMSTELKNWSESRQYCRDHGGDLVIINTEEKQRFISSFIKERVWIGLTDIENEGSMIWVDNSPLDRGFWAEGEPNDEHGIEDCIELMPSKLILNNWNDLPCSITRKGICEK